MTGPLDTRSVTLIQKLWQLWVRPYRGAISFVLALMVLVAVTTSLYPLIIQWTFEKINARDLHTVYLIPLLIIGVTCLRAGLMFVQSVKTSAVVNAVVVDVQNALYQHLLHADLSRLTRDPIGTLTSRFSVDVEALRMALNRCMTGFIRDGLTVLALIGTILYIDPLLTIIVFVVYPLVGTPILRLGQRIRKTSGNLQATIGELTAFLQQSFSGMRMVKSYRLEDYEGRRASKTFSDLYNTMMKTTRLRARVDPLLEVAGGLAVAGVLWFGTWRVASGTGSIGGFTGFVTALLMLAQPMRSLGNLNSILQEGLAAAERLFTVLGEQPKVLDAPHAVPLSVSKGAVEFDNVWFAYEPERAALRGLCLKINPGETVALVGRSGGGKSTIFNLLARFYDAQQGAVRIDGQDVRQVTLASLRDAITLVSQDVIVFNDTAKANIAFGKAGADNDAIRAAARAAEADEFIESLPAGYDTNVGESGGALSGGQKQRLVLARAFLRNSPILLLDEATSALDSVSEELVQRAIQRLSAGRTTLIIAHRLSTVRHANRICVVDQGTIREEGTHEDLLAKGGLYAELYALQFKGS